MKTIDCSRYGFSSSRTYLGVSPNFHMISPRAKFGLECLLITHLCYYIKPRTKTMTGFFISLMFVIATIIRSTRLTLIKLKSSTYILLFLNLICFFIIFRQEMNELVCIIFQLNINVTYLIVTYSLHILEYLHHNNHLQNNRPLKYVSFVVHYQDWISLWGWNICWEYSCHWCQRSLKESMNDKGITNRHAVGWNQ